MPEYQILTVFAAFAFAYSLVASRLERTPISGAIVYLATGILLGPEGLGLIDLQVNGEGLRQLAEFALAVCLFTDSSNANLTVLRRIEAIPVRLLLVGLPLTIALGLGFGTLLFPDLSVMEAALIATMLAPTDAALGKAVISNASVPVEVRESLNVESGLNDGICVPVLLIFLMIAGDTVGGSESISLALRLPLEVIGIGVVTGLGLAVTGGLALRLCAARGWVADTWLQIPVIALALLCFAFAQRLGGSGFIASFVGGLVFGGITRKHKEQFLRAAEGTADIFALITWVSFGTVVVGILLRQPVWQVILYAVLSLTVVRMLPVWLCLLGKRLQPDTLLFIGWFGPRGLASIVFVVLVMDGNLAGNTTIVATASWTIVLSIICHGISANSLARRYGAVVKRRHGEI